MKKKTLNMLKKMTISNRTIWFLRKTRYFNGVGTALIIFLLAFLHNAIKDALYSSDENLRGIVVLIIILCLVLLLYSLCEICTLLFRFYIVRGCYDDIELLYLLEEEENNLNRGLIITV